MTHVLSTGQSLCWLTGWNFVTDIYRALERSLRGPETAQDTFAQDLFQRHHELPGPLREAPDVTSSKRLNRVGYQAVNIGRALQLLRVELAVVQRAGAAKRCDIVKLAACEIGSTPVWYQAAVSASTMDHLGILGAFLDSAPDRPLTQADSAEVGSVKAFVGKLQDCLQAMRSALLEAAYYPKTLLDPQAKSFRGTIVAGKANMRVHDFEVQLRLLDEQRQRLQRQQG